MKSNRLKNLANIRLVLTVIAVLLAGLMIFSGIMHFVVGSKAAPEEQPVQPTASNQETPDTTVTGEATEPDPTSTMEDEKNQGGAVSAEDYDKDGEVPEAADDGGTGFESAEPTVKETEPPQTEPLQTEPLQTEPPQTEPPQTEPLQTEPPQTEPPQTEPPQTEPLQTEPPQTEPPQTEPPQTERGSTNPRSSLSAELPQDSATERTVDLRPIGGAEDETSEATAATEDPVAPVEVLPQGEEEVQQPRSLIWLILFWVSAGLLAADLVAILIISRKIQEELDRRQKAKETPVPVVQPSRDPITQRVRRPLVKKKELAAVTVGTIHQIGARDYQQDSLGHTGVMGDKGTLAIVADGMGGLSGGEKVSQKIVMTALALAGQLKPSPTNGILQKMVLQINEEVNRFLGPDGLYKSGSTVVAVLVHGGSFQWISVGDSRIYLYRQGYANQLNQDHDQLQAWMGEVLEGKRSMEETLRHPDGRKLTSFIGMGQLKHIDCSHSPIALEPGDRLVLMSDGVYGMINEELLAAILKRCPDVNQAAATMDRMIREAKNPHQDNYTAIILGF